MFKHFLSDQQEKQSSTDSTVKGTDRQFIAEALEARVLFSGAPVDAVAVESPDSVKGDGSVEFQSLDSLGRQDVAIPAAQTEVRSQQSVILSSLDNLTSDEIAKLADAAATRWQDAGLTAEQEALLEDIEISIVDLESNSIGAADGTTVYLDWNAAGKDWFIDETPFQDEEFEFAVSSTVLRDLDGEAQYGVDLVSVLVHEMGHVLGLEDIYSSAQSGSVMYNTFGEGERRLPSTGQANGAEAGSLDGIRYAVTPGGTLGDSATFQAATAGETLTAGTGSADGTVLTHTFDTTLGTADPTYELNPSGSDSTEIALSAGRHLVLYNAQFNTSGTAGAEPRTEVQANLELNGVDLAIGSAQGYTRDAGGADETIVTGGGIIDVAADDQILQLETLRSDSGTNTLSRINGTTNIQLLKLDDSWDYLSLSGTSNSGTVSGTTAVSYATDNSTTTKGSSFTYSGGSDITLNDPGLYLVFANTGIDKNLEDGTRTFYSQELTLGGVAVSGTKTTTYLRGNANAESANHGVATIGTILDLSTGGQTLNVNVTKEHGTNSIITGDDTAITIIKLPGTTEILSLSDSSNQQVNDGSVAAPDPVAFGTQNSTSTLFSHTAGSDKNTNAAVTVNQDGDYLFLSSLHVAGVTADRVVPQHGWRIDGSGSMLSQGQGAEYNRNDPNDAGADQSGSWSGLVQNLTNGQTVEMVTAVLGAGGTAGADAVNLFAISIDSLIPSNDPVIGNNNPLSTFQNSTGNTITTALLSTVDADTPATGLTYTVTSAPTGGTLRLNGSIVDDQVGTNTFTQDDIDNNRVTFDSGATEGVSFGFNFTVSDGGAAPANGTFVIVVGETTVVNPDDETGGGRDEDTIFNTGNVLANDAGTSLTSTTFGGGDISAFDATSVQGATITNNNDGTFGYDPTGSAILQALDTGSDIVDTFTYTVTDFQGNNTVGTVTITVDGVNDAPVVRNESLETTDRTSVTANLIGNETDVDLPADSLTLTALDGNVVAGLTTFVTAKGATVTVNTDGTFTYDPSTSTTLAALADGASDTETLVYTVSDGETSVTTPSVTVTTFGTPGASNDSGTVDANASGPGTDPPLVIDALSNDSVISGAAGTATGGALIELLASTTGNNNSTWNTSGTASGDTGAGSINVTGATLNTSPSDAPPGVTAYYEFSGSSSGSTFNAPSIDEGVSNNPWGLTGETMDDQPTSFEFVFRPTDLNGNVAIFDSGGATTGLSLVLLGDQLVWTVGEGGTRVAQAVATVPASAIAGRDFVHVVAIFDDAADEARLYVNGTLSGVGASTNLTSGNSQALDGWGGTGTAGIGSAAAGADGGSIATLGNSGTVDIPTVADFQGDFALVRVYSNKVLNTTEIGNNFNSVFGSTSTAPAVLSNVTEVNGNSSFSVDVAETLTSGATVTLKADGTFEYDPNGAFDNVGLGLTASDSFTYRLDSNVNGLATVNITINGTFVQATTTEVSLVGGVLTITDTDGSVDNAYELTVNGSDLIISEKNSGLIDAIGALDTAPGDGTNDVTIALSAFDGINIVTAGGTDSVTINSDLDVGTGPLTITSESIVINGNVTTGGTIDLNGATTLTSGVLLDSSSANGTITFNGAITPANNLQTLSFNSGSGVVNFTGDVGSTATPFVGISNQGTGLATFASGTTIHTANAVTTFSGPGGFLILGTVGETPALTGTNAGLQADGATVTFGNAGNGATISINDAASGAATFDTRNGGGFEFINLTGPVSFSDAPDNANVGNGSLIIGTGSNSLTIDFIGGNIETAISNGGIGQFEFLSGTVNLNSNNFITGQGTGSQAGSLGDRVTIGGGTVEAHLNLNATVEGDWNTNSGSGFAEILTNGRVTARTLNLGSNATESIDGLDLLINGGTLELTGDIDFRNDGNGNNDKITLQSGVLDGDADGLGGGTFSLRDSLTSAFEFLGGTMKGFANFSGTLTQDGGTLQIGTDASNGSTMAITTDYDLNAGALEITLGNIDSSESDSLAVGGNVDLTGTGSLNLVLGAGYATTVAGEGNVITLLSYAGTLTGEFANFTDGQEFILNGTDVYSIDYGTGSNSAITLTLVRDNDVTAPIPTFSPADDATAVLSDANLVLTFDENVYPITGGGEIRLVDDTPSTGGVIETWSFTSGLPSGITIVGNVVTINPTADLASLTNYHVEISGPANLGNTNAVFENISGLDFAGIGDATTWNFQSVNTSAATVTIDQAGGQTDPTSNTTINFTAVFSEAVNNFDGSDIDFTGSTAPGTLVANVSTSDNITFDIQVTGMTGDGDVVVSIPADAANAQAGGLATAPSTSTDNTVSYIFNFAPTANPLDQTITYSSLPATGIALEDILITDANDVGNTSITTSEGLFINYPAGGGTGGGDQTTTTFTTSDPDNAAGFAMEVIFTPDAADLADGSGVGSENRRVLFETGGSSNGSGIYLIDGIPYFISKVAGDNQSEPDALAGGNDTTFDGGGVHVKLSDTKLLAGESTSIALVFNFSSLRYSVNGTPEASVVLAGASGTNWSGNDTVNIGNSGGPGGIPDGNTTTDTGGTFIAGSFLSLSGNNPVSSAKLWNASGGLVNITTSQKTDDFTATLTVNGGTGIGTLSASQNTGSAGIAGSGTDVITITGNRTDVNLALATLTFDTGGSIGSVETISLSIDDGDEDGSGALSGTITVAGGQDTLYVDDNFSGTIGQSITDADLGTSSDQAGVFGIDSFATLQEALDRANANATIIVNGGTYNETIVLDNGVTLQVTGPDASQTVNIDGLGAAAGTAIQIEGTSTLNIGDGSNTSIVEGDITGATGTLTIANGSTLQIGNGGTSGSLSAGTITNDGSLVFNRSNNLTVSDSIGGTGSLTQAGTGALTLTGSHSYTGTTTINASTGNLNIGDGTTTGSLAANAAIITNDIVVFNPASNETVTQSGVISGSGQVRIGNRPSDGLPGNVVFTTANTFTGEFQLGAGDTNIGSGSQTDTMGQNVIVHDSAALGTGVIRSLGAQLQAGTTGINLANNVLVPGGGFRMGGSNDFEVSGLITVIDSSTRGIGNYSGTGITVTLSGGFDLGNADVDVDTANEGGDISFEGSDNPANAFVVGAITGFNDVVVNANFDGTVTFTGANDYTGNTTVQGLATLVLANGSTHTGGGTYTLQSGTRLEGSGSTNSAVTINDGATLAPGVGANGTGTLSVGSLTAGTGATLVFELNEIANPSAAFDQISSTGAVNITGATLQLINPNATGLEDETAIATLISSSALTGTFVDTTASNLADGATVNIQGNEFTLNYSGTAVTLTPINDGPTFDFSSDPIEVDEAVTGSAQTFAGFITNFSDNEGDSIASYVVTIETETASSGTLFASGGEPAIDNSGTLTFTPSDGVNGEALIKVVATDSGGGVSTAFFSIEVDATDPTFNLGGGTSADDTGQPFALNSLEDTIERLFPTAGSIIVKALPNTSSETDPNGDLTLDSNQVQVNDEIPISDLGNLVFTPDDNAGNDSTYQGTFRFTYQIRNADGSLGSELVFATSEAREAPLRASATVEVSQDSEPVTVDGFARITGSHSSPLRFELSASRLELFSDAPRISPEGTLFFSTSPSTSGVSIVTVELTDGNRSFGQQSFLIRVVESTGVPSTGNFGGINQSLVFDVLNLDRSVGNELLVVFSGTGAPINSDAAIDFLIGNVSGQSIRTLVIFEDLAEFQSNLKAIVNGSNNLNFRVVDLDRLNRGDVRIHGGQRIAPEGGNSKADEPLKSETNEDDLVEPESKSNADSAVPSDSSLNAATDSFPEKGEATGSSLDQI